MSLFALGNFVLSSGERSGWRINADVLTEEDWEALAFLAHLRLPAYGEVECVPTGGGEAFARQLRRFCVPGGALLICDDVWTTGRSMERQRAGREASGVAAFARGECPAWVVPLFVLRDGRAAGRMVGYEMER